MSEEVKRGPGRPRAEIKKGTKSWQPSNLGDVINKEPGYRYRWVRKDPDNLAKKREEGWESVSGETKAIHPESRPDEPHQLTSVPERRDGVLMRLDEETAQERDKYHNQKTARLEKRLNSQTKGDLAKEGAAVHGTITKERQGVRTIID